MTVETLAEQVTRLENVEAMLARADQVSAWQDIETAPKDGTEVFVWLPESVSYGGFSSNPRKAIWLVDLDEWQVENVGGNIPPAPTHWKPLGDPPA